ncbi:hypothetical protein [Tardibacter chloracetimidivorans]|uniref:hypothetical protein n=1 Tax=Tardibacter chloracetimidivorans TaxID=1921510 RepID=UPI0013014070|nr:hypothetical protein [Tardibacter chloracetimidivorans]
MTKSNKTKQTGEQRPLVVKAEKDETEPDTMARVMVGPYLRHGIVGSDIAKKMVGKLPGEPNFDDFGKAIKAKAETSLKGDTSLASELLTAQALSLDTMFTELARRATMNLGDYPLAAERYARLAFKAQSNCRAALEALAKLHQPREQTVRHVHVSEGGQAVVADHFHHHGGSRENGKASEQPHATGTAGASPTLSGPDPFGNSVPIPGGEGETAMQDARRQGQRST